MQVMRSQVDSRLFIKAIHCVLVSGAKKIYCWLQTYVVINRKAGGEIFASAKVRQKDIIATQEQVKLFARSIRSLY